MIGCVLLLRRRVLGELRPLILTACLLLLLARRLEAEDRADFKFYYYEEDGDRVTTYGPAMYFEFDTAQGYTFEFQAVYDVISGASPTGAPPTNPTFRVPGLDDDPGFVTVSGASAATSFREIPIPGSALYLPTSEFDDQRWAYSGALSRRFGDYLLTAEGAYSIEGDYISRGGGLTVAREFNQQSTILQFGTAAAFDELELLPRGLWDEKESYEWLVGLTQVIDKYTTLTANVALIHETGFLSDPYKVSEVGGVIVSERRPGDRNSRVAYLALNRFFEPLNGAAEVSYRFYDDSFGIDSHTTSLIWRQKLGSKLTLSPLFRYYTQSAADFYAVRFVGDPEVFSSDYRLSKFDAVSFGGELRYDLQDDLALNFRYERYHQEGRDGVTWQDAYASANMFTVGLSWQW